MAIKASGSFLSFTEIVTFWGGSTPHSLSEYYSDGDNVFSGAEDEAGNDIPSSSTIKFSDFYSTATITTGGTTNFTADGTYTIPVGVSSLTVTIYGGGGQGGEGDETGTGGAGGGGGSGGVIQGTLTISNNVKGNPTAQTIAVTVGAGGDAGTTNAGSQNASSGAASTVVYDSQTTSAGGGGSGGGFIANGTAYDEASQGGNSIGSNFSASTNNTGTAADGEQAASGDAGSSNGTAGKALPTDPISAGSTGGTAGSTSSNSAATGGDASVYGAGGGGAASIDRTGDGHWYGGAGSAGYVRIVVAG